MTSRQDLIKAITAEFDKKRTAFLSLPYFELYEFVSKDFIVPEKNAFEIQNSKNRYRLQAIMWTIFALALTPVYIIAADDPVFFIVITFMIYGFAAYYWYGFFDKSAVLSIDKENMAIGNKTTIPWINILTVHFLELKGRHSRETLIVHYLDESDELQKTEISIADLEYKPREIASIIKTFMHNRT